MFAASVQVEALVAVKVGEAATVRALVMDSD